MGEATESARKPSRHVALASKSEELAADYSQKAHRSMSESEAEAWRMFSDHTKKTNKNILHTSDMVPPQALPRAAARERTDTDVLDEAEDEGPPKVPLENKKATEQSIAKKEKKTRK